MWKIVQIFDGDYGCEELEPGAKQKVSVTLENENGEHRILSVEDDWLVEKGLDVGSVWEENAMADNTFEQISRKEEKESMGTTEEYLIANTTKEERIALIRQWIPDDDGIEDSGMDLWDMYADYINGVREIAEINAAMSGQFYTEEDL